MKIFGRDWREGGYEEIDDFSPWCQAWEFLRRNPTYQLDCKVVMSFFSWRDRLDEQSFNFELKLAKHDSSDVKERVIEEELKNDASIDLVDAIRGLSSKDIVNLMLENPRVLVARRHGLNTEEEGLPLLPEEEICCEYQSYIFSEFVGGEVVLPHNPWEDGIARIPARHAAVIVDIRQSIANQLAFAKLQLEEERKEMLKNYPSHHLRGHAREELLNFNGEIENSSHKSRNISMFIRILDAITEKKTLKEVTDLEIYEYLDPDKYNKPDTKGDVEKRATWFVDNKLKEALKYREYRYSELYNTQMRSLKLEEDK